MVLFCIAFKTEGNEDMVDIASPGVVLILVLVTITSFTIKFLHFYTDELHFRMPKIYLLALNFSPIEFFHNVFWI